MAPRCATLDDLLWSISAKERTAQKARLAKLVPAMIRNLRAGAAARARSAAERVKPLLETIYQLHMAAIKPRVAGSAPAPAPATVAALGRCACGRRACGPCVRRHASAVGAHAGASAAAALRSVGPGPVPLRPGAGGRGAALAARSSAEDRQRSRLRHRNGRRHVARVRQGRQDGQRAPVVDQSDAQQIYVHQPRARRRSSPRRRTSHGSWVRARRR